MAYGRQRTEEGDHGDDVSVAHLAEWHHQRNRRLPISADAVTKHSRELRIGIAPDPSVRIRREILRIERPQRTYRQRVPA